MQSELSEPAVLYLDLRFRSRCEVQPSCTDVCLDRGLRQEWWQRSLKFGVEARASNSRKSTFTNFESCVKRTQSICARWVDLGRKLHARSQSQSVSCATASLANNVLGRNIWVKYSEFLSARSRIACAQNGVCGELGRPCRKDAEKLYHVETRGKPNRERNPFGKEHIENRGVRLRRTVDPS